MRLTENVYLGLVMAGSSKGEVFSQEKLNAWTRPRFGRNWWFWLPVLNSNGGRFQKNLCTDINLHLFCWVVSLTVYPRERSKDNGRTAEGSDEGGKKSGLNILKGDAT